MGSEMCIRDRYPPPSPPPCPPRQVHMVDVVQSQIVGRTTFKNARAYFAGVSRSTYEAEDEAAAQPAVAAAGGGAAGPSAGARPAGAHHVTADRVGALYAAYLHRLRGRPAGWVRRGVGAELPASWVARFGLDNHTSAIWEEVLDERVPSDMRDLPLENGTHPLVPVEPGSLAWAFREQIARDAAASYLHARTGAGARAPGGGAAVALSLIHI